MLMESFTFTRLFVFVEWVSGSTLRGSLSAAARAS